MSDIWELSTQLGAAILFYVPDESINKKGMYHRDLGLGCLDDTLSKKKQENFLLHELGHNYYNHIHFSCHTFGYSSKQEKKLTFI